MICVYENRDSSGGGLAKNAGDVAGVALAGGARYLVADINVVAAGGLVEAGLIAQCHVVAASAISECTKADSDAPIAIDVVSERAGTDRRVIVSSSVTKEGAL